MQSKKRQHQKVKALPNFAVGECPSVRKPVSITVGLALGVTTIGERAVSKTAPVRTRTDKDTHLRDLQTSIQSPPPAQSSTRIIRRAVLPRRHHANSNSTLINAKPPVSSEKPKSPAPVVSTSMNITCEAEAVDEITTVVPTDGEEAATITEKLVVKEIGCSIAPARMSNKDITIQIGQKRRADDKWPTKSVSCFTNGKRHVTEDVLRAVSSASATQCQTAHQRSTLISAERARDCTASMGDRKEAFDRIRDFFSSRLDVGLDIQRAALKRYLEAEDSQQGLFITGSSPQSTSPVVRALLHSILDELPSHPDCFYVKGHLYSTPSQLYDGIRHQMHGIWKLPRWRDVNAQIYTPEDLPKAYLPSTTCILVVENIDSLVKPLNRIQAPLERLFRFLNCLVQAHGLKLLVIGHNTQTVEWFASYFGGYDLNDQDEYMLHFPHYTIQTMSAHLEAVATAALAPMGGTVQLKDIFAKQVIEFAVRKAKKAGQCELEPMVSLFLFATIRMRNQGRHNYSPNENTSKQDPSKWMLRYEHVMHASAKLFQHDYVHRVQCVGPMTQAVLLVLIDAGPCTKEELVHHIYERHKVHVWILTIIYFQREKFNAAMEVLLAVPVVKTHEVREWRDDRWYTRTLYYALPSREQFIEAAGKQPLIKLIL